MGTAAYRALVAAFAEVRETPLACFGIRVFIDAALPPDAWELRPAR